MASASLTEALDLARSGDTVLYVARSQAHSRVNMAEAAEVATDAARVRRTAGLERIEFQNGGRLTFRSYRPTHAVRGLSLDAAYVPADVWSEGLAYEIAPSFAAKARGYNVITY